MAEGSTEPEPIRRGRRIGFIAAAGLLALGALFFGFVQLFAPRGPIAPDFSLTDQNGHPFRLSAQHGHAVALFFGYTHCPDVCPTTLASLARARRELGPARDTFVVVFVTVDPKRDTPAIVGRYVRQFDPSFIGLSGTPAQLAPVYAAYNVYHQALPAHGTAEGYLVAHSSTVDFIGPTGRIRARGDWSDSPDELAADVRKAAS